MSDALDWKLWAIVLLCGAATYIWRAAAVLIGARVDPDGELFRLFSCIAYAMLAGLISRMVILPEGLLAEAPLAFRLAGIGAAVVVFFALKRNLAAGVFTGVAVFGLLTAFGDALI
jgi:branched-subunit amino acid transport protein